MSATGDKDALPEWDGKDETWGRHERKIKACDARHGKKLKRGSIFRTETKKCPAKIVPVRVRKF